MKRLALIAALSFAALPATAQWNVTTTPLGNGWSTQNATGPNGQSWTGTTVPLGNGWSTTNYNDNQGHQTTCTTTPLGMAGRRPTATDMRRGPGSHWRPTQRVLASER